MAERPTYAKSTCCILGCPKWSRKFPGEWLCGRHWRMVRKSCRAALNTLWRRSIRTMHDYRLERRLWAHAVRQVSLREAGL